MHLSSCIAVYPAPIVAFLFSAQRAIVLWRAWCREYWRALVAIGEHRGHWCLLSRRARIALCCIFRQGGPHSTRARCHLSALLANTSKLLFARTPSIYNLAGWLACLCFVPPLHLASCTSQAVSR
jgi:hypothetical protein